ncbi:hypothetical protein [Nonomuraea sp. NPDC001699]
MVKVPAFGFSKLVSKPLVNARRPDIAPRDGGSTTDLPSRPTQDMADWHGTARRARQRHVRAAGELRPQAR